MKVLDKCKDELAIDLEEGEILHRNARGEGASLSSGNVGHNTSGVMSDSSSASSMKLEKDPARARNSVSPKELSRGTKREPADQASSQCISGCGLGETHHSLMDGMGRSRGGHHHSSHNAHSQFHGHGLNLQRQSLCLVTSNSHPLAPESISPIESSVSNFTVENFLSPSHITSLGGDVLPGGSTAALTSRPSSLVSSTHALPYPRSSEIYQGTAACGHTTSPSAGSYSYQPCGSGSSSSGYPSSSTPHLSTSHGQQPGTGLTGHHQHGIMSMPTNNSSASSNSSSINNHGCSDESTGSPHSTPHHLGGHGHLPPHQHPSHHDGISPSVFSSISQHKDYTYPRPNGWYMNPGSSMDLNPGPTDFGSFTGMSMRDMFQSSASCQLAAFRTPQYKTSSAPYYDCTKY